MYFLQMVQEWITLHKDTLMEIWKTREFACVSSMSADMVLFGTMK